MQAGPGRQHSTHLMEQGAAKPKYTLVCTELEFWSAACWGDSHGVGHRSPVPGGWNGTGLGWLGAVAGAGAPSQPHPNWEQLWRLCPLTQEKRPRTAGEGAGPVPRSHHPPHCQPGASRTHRPAGHPPAASTHPPGGTERPALRQGTRSCQGRTGTVEWESPATAQSSPTIPPASPLLRTHEPWAAGTILGRSKAPKASLGWLRTAEQGKGGTRGCSDTTQIGAEVLQSCCATAGEGSMQTPRNKCCPSTSQEPVAQAHRQTLPCSCPPWLPSPSLKAQGGVSTRAGWKEGPLIAAALLHHTERSTGRQPPKNRCQQNSFPLVWVLGAPKHLLTSLATPTTKQCHGLGEGGRRGERTLLPRLLSPSLGIPQQEGAGWP